MRAARSLVLLARGQEGSAVLAVLLLLTLFIGVGFAFRQLTSLEGRVVAGHAHRLQALECARAGVEVAVSVLRSEDASFDGLSDPWASGPLLRGSLGAGATYSVQAEGDLLDNGIYDAASRLAVNGLAPEVLARLPGLSARAALDVEAARSGGRIGSLEQFLRLARLDEAMFRRSAGDTPERLLTVLGRGGAVNANTAPAFVLGVALGDEELAQRLVARRRGPDGLDGTPDDRPWRSLEELRPELVGRGGPGASEAPAREVQELVSVSSSLFSVTATGQVRDGSFYARRRLRALVERSAEGVRVLWCAEL